MFNWKVQGIKFLIFSFHSPKTEISVTVWIEFKPILYKCVKAYWTRNRKSNSIDFQVQHLCITHSKIMTSCRKFLPEKFGVISHFKILGALPLKPSLRSSLHPLLAKSATLELKKMV